MPRENMLRDPSYAPYCMPCPGAQRMRRVSYLRAECPRCGAVHEIEGPEMKYPIHCKTINDLDCSFDHDDVAGMTELPPIEASSSHPNGVPRRTIVYLKHPSQAVRGSMVVDRQFAVLDSVASIRAQREALPEPPNTIDVDELLAKLRGVTIEGQVELSGGDDPSA